MSIYDKLVILRAMTGCTDDDTLLVYLGLAGAEIVRKAYPYDDSKRDVPCRYDTLQCEIACYLYNKRGAEGQTAHQENGINRSYESAGVPASMLSGVTPYVGVI